MLEKGVMERIEHFARLIKNVGIIIGVPVIIAVAIYFHNAEISALEAENNLLRQTQYDKALAMIEAQDKLRKNERRIVSETLSLINGVMVEVEKFTHIQGPLPDDFSTDAFERDIQDISKKLKELEETLATKKEIK